MPGTITAGLPEAIARTQASLARYQHALGPGPDSDPAIDAAWTLHRDVAALLPAALALLAERDDLARRLETARRDPLTGLPTRAAFTTAAEQLLTTAPAVVLLDLVDFKAVNDTHGHETGDAVLAAVGRRLADWAGPAAACGRLGGDEFTVVLDTDPADLPERIVKLRALLEQPVEHDGQVLAVGASIGTATRTTGHPDLGLSALLHAADQAMYADKGRGRRGRRQTLTHTLAA
ncbi:GGDEF domain-containing protein [Kitasatospora sp. NBC_01302]|uniref:GGDEF domain-containing protein n=1 Tax=Kitasatospora sp. NBC_01302 TaxID=2903575 RepID=UPI002E0ED40D|nr:GGDEF domain-containing protein [Kitasatospora sp. NBC_01302]